MPTNLIASLKPLVRLKPNESCYSLKRHFEEGVMREVIGAWEAQLRKYPNDKNFLWVDVPWTVVHTVKGHNKKASFKERTSYGRNMVDRAYFTAREMGIVSRPLDMEIDGVIRRGFILTPHDAVCARTKVGCLWTGPYKVLGTSWRSEMQFKDGKPIGKKSVIFTGFLEGSGHDKGQEVGQYSGHDEGQYLGQEVGQQNRVAAGSGVGSVVETTEIIEPVVDNRNTEGTPPSISESKSDTYPLNQLVSQFQENLAVRQTPAPTEPANGDQTSDIENQKQEGTENPSTTLSSSLVTDLPEANPLTWGRGDRASRAITIEQFFKDVDGDALIPKLSAGYIGSETVDKWRNDAGLLKACWDVIEKQAAKPLYSNRNLGDLMADIMVTYKEDTGKKTPKEWYPTVRRLRNEEGVPLVGETPPPGKGPGYYQYIAVLQTPISYADIDERLHHDELVRLDSEFRRHETVTKTMLVYGDCWRIFHDLLATGDKLAVSRELCHKLREWYWEHDAAPEKPPGPPWETQSSSG